MSAFSRACLLSRARLTRVLACYSGYRFFLIIIYSKFNGFCFFQVDLADIKTEYKKKTGQTLKATIQNELKGDLEKLLLQIVGD